MSGATARLRWVAAGARDGTSVEIRAGLEPGERVVLEPSGLADGSPVREQRTGAATQALPEEGK